MKNDKPSRLLLALFRCFCHPDFREEIEGDLLECFHLNTATQGSGAAHWLLLRDVLLLFRPEIILPQRLFTPLNFLHMKKSDWLLLLALNLLFAIFIALPFLPGPPNIVAKGLWLLAQFTGIFALLSLPFSLAWAIAEWRRRSKRPAVLNNWNSGFYFAIAVTVMGTLTLSLMAFVLWEEQKPWASGLTLLLLAFGLSRALPAIRLLRQRSAEARFSPAPVLLMSILVFGLMSNLCFAGPLISGGRNKAIQDCGSLISAIEDFKSEQGRYPESLDELALALPGGIPQPGVMGITEYSYEKMGDAYQVSFKQHMGESDEVVVYQKDNQHIFKYKWHNDDIETGVPNWRYYWID